MFVFSFFPLPPVELQVAQKNSMNFDLSICQKDGANDLLNFTTPGNTGYTWGHNPDLPVAHS